MDTFLVVLVGWIFSLCLHEFSHAIVAYWGGDLSVKDKGYLSFNPIKYVDPLFSIVLPIIFLLIGGLGLPGGAVYIDRSRLRNKIWDSAVSLAGPISNLFLAIVIALILQIDAVSNSSAAPVLSFLGMLQASVFVLNLVPIPPLDGFGAIAPFLPDSIREAAYAYGSYGVFLIFFALFQVDAASREFWGLVHGISDTLGISRQLAYEGQTMFQFWKQWH